MRAYKLRVTDSAGALVVGGTLQAPDEATAIARFRALRLPRGRAELLLGERVVARRQDAEAAE